MSPQPIRISAAEIDLSARSVSYATVDASPTDSTETVIATLTIPSFNDLAAMSGVRLRAWAAFTVGTNGVNANLKIRRTSVAGTTIAATGNVTQTAANLDELDVVGFDAGAGVGVYVLTLTVGSASAASTVSKLALFADVI